LSSTLDHQQRVNQEAEAEAWYQHRVHYDQLGLAQLEHARALALANLQQRAGESKSTPGADTAALKSNGGGSCQTRSNANRYVSASCLARASIESEANLRRDAALQRGLTSIHGRTK